MKDFPNLFTIFRRGGIITCIVTGTRRYSSDLEQGGLEIPCVLIFKATTIEMKKLKTLLKKTE